MIIPSKAVRADVRGFCFKLLPRLRHRYSRLESANRLPEKGTVFRNSFEVEDGRYPSVRFIRIDKTWLHHANDRKRAPIQMHCRAEYGTISAISLLPQTMTDH